MNHMQNFDGLFAYVVAFNSCTSTFLITSS